MKIRTVVVVYKKSHYEIRVHEEHSETVRQVKAILKDLDVPYRIYPRYALKQSVLADLIITVGGDGTFLETAHFVSGGVMLGVNSHPDTSMGYFCAATGETFRRKLEQITKRKAKLKKLQRLQAFMGNRKIGSPVLNEILFAASNPAAMLRYLIGIEKKGRKSARRERASDSLRASEPGGVGEKLAERFPHDYEEQRGSGVWIATPAGTTAAIRSAGGPRLQREARRFAYQVREPQTLPRGRYRFIRGILEAGSSLHLTPKMEGACIFIDGSHESHPIPRGKTVSIKLSQFPLKVVG